MIQSFRTDLNKMLKRRTSVQRQSLCATDIPHLRVATDKRDKGVAQSSMLLSVHTEWAVINEVLEEERESVYIYVCVCVCV